MSQRSRALIAVAGVLVLVVAFALLRPGDDKDNKNSNASSTATTSPPPGSATTVRPAETTSSTPATAAPKPHVTVVHAVDLQPQGGIKSIKVHKGDTVRFTVTSDQPESVHLHGYDVEKPVGPGRPARYVFKATIEGIFEVELEESAHQLIKLEVDP